MSTELDYIKMVTAEWWRDFVGIGLICGLYSSQINSSWDTTENYEILDGYFVLVWGSSMVHTDESLKDLS